MRYGRRIAYCFRCDPGAVQREKQPLLDTFRELVSIESGSSDFEGVTRTGNRIAERLRALGGEVEKVPHAFGEKAPNGFCCSRVVSRAFLLRRQRPCGDDKHCVAAILHVLSTLKSVGFDHGGYAGRLRSRI